MARLVLSPYTPIGSYPALPLTALSADLAFAVPGTYTDGISFVNDGRKILLAWNQNGGGSGTVTISSVAFRGRTGDITTYSIAASTISVFGPFDPAGWNQTNGSVYAVGSAATVLFSVLNLPTNLFQRA